MKISEISELTNTPASTIRAYEKWGLITPPQRQSNGYRFIILEKRIMSLKM